MGNTLSSVPKTFNGSVHPHTHGEHFAGTNWFPGICGSSPHAWGTLTAALMANPIGRFIPTRMGNTYWSPEPERQLPVHPHTHGEHVPSTLLVAGQIGSSPHAWGTRHLFINNNSLVWFIPTRMGNTRKSGNC